MLSVIAAALAYMGKVPINVLSSEDTENQIWVNTLVEANLAEPFAQPMTSPAIPQWEFSESEGLAKLWLAATDLPSPTSLCPPPEITRLSCGIGSARVWNELVSLNRPVLLETVTRDKFFASVLLFQIDGSDAVVWTDQGLQWVKLADIANAWTGTYRFFWQAPPGWEGALSLGDSGVSVTQVAQMFATLDGMELAEVAEFSPALETRIRLFQEAEGLPIDGVMNRLTLLRLNERLGVGLTVSRALTRAQNWQDVR